MPCTRKHLNIDAGMLKASLCLARFIIRLRAGIGLSEPHHRLDFLGIRAHFLNLCIAMRISQKSICTRAMNVPTTPFSEVRDA